MIANIEGSIDQLARLAWDLGDYVRHLGGCRSQIESEGDVPQSCSCGLHQHMDELIALGGSKPTGPLVYVFLVRREIDSESWPSVYSSPEFAEKARGRISRVMQLRMQLLPDMPK